MAIRAIIGFEHLPPNDVNWGNYATHGLTRAADSSLKSMIVNGWIVDKDTAGTACRYTIPLAPYLVAPVGKIWFSVRMKLNQNPNPGAGIIYMNSTYIFLISHIPGYVIGGIYHLEFGWDLTTNVVERWVNGVKIADYTGPGANLRTVTWGLEGKGSVAAMIDWRDLTICDDQGAAQGLPVGPLGPRDVVPITLDSAVGSDWVTTPAATPLLSVVGDTGVNPTTTFATSDINTKGPLVASMLANIPAGKVVTAIELIATTQSSGIAAVSTGAKLRKGTDETVANFLVAPPSAWNYNASLGVFHKAPGGLAWTNATIDGTSIVLSPDV